MTNAAWAGQGNVYVVCGYRKSGGSYMPYHLGRILHENFGRPCFVVDDLPRDPNRFWEYPIEFESISIEQMEQRVTGDDVIVTNSHDSRVNGIVIRSCDG